LVVTFCFSCRSHHARYSHSLSRLAKEVMSNGDEKW
jgi:hypothetical protein